MRYVVFALVLCIHHLVQAQPASCQKGLADIDAKRYMQAQPALTRCLEQALPPEARAYVLRARAHARAELKQWDAAVTDQKQSIVDAVPKDVWPHTMLGAYLREAGQYDEALAALKAALAFDEDGPGSGPGMAVHYHTAQTLHAGRFREAVEVMTLGIPKQPDYGYAVYQRALSYEALGDSAQAKRDLFRAAELAPKEGYEPAIAKKLGEYGFRVKTRSE